MVKPRSAKMTSPGSINSRNPESCVMALSEALPPYPDDRNDIAPFGVMATRYLMVLWCL